MKKNIWCGFLFAAALSIFFLFPGTGFSQIQRLDASVDQFYPDVRADEEMQPGRAKGKRGVSYGGWITPVFLTEQNGIPSAPTSIVTTLKLWINVPFGDNAGMYARGKDVFLRTLEDSETVDQNENTVDLDAGYIFFASPGRAFRVVLGRKFFMLGTGLVFNGRGDGGEIDWFSRYLNLKVFSAYTGLLEKDTNPYRISDRDVSDGAKRLFVGGSLSTDIGNQTLYALGLFQKDYADEEGTTKSRYDSTYYGLGVKGVLLESLAYYGEYIYETGTSYLTNSSTEQDIKAMALQAGLTYYFESAYKPALIFQYSYGSGDSDRSDHGTATGNTSGDDNGFISFGTYVGGYALRPLPGNLHVIRAGVAAVPFDKSDSSRLKEMTVIVKYSYYMKDKEDAPVNYGADATLEDRFVGHGGDIAVRWKIFYDLSAFMNYALFIPGDAYAEGIGNRHFFMAGLNLHF